MKRLETALDIFIIQCKSAKINVCLVLNGSDEFGGDATKLLDIIQDMTKSRRIKAIIYSRPESLFVEDISSYEGIRLQDLTGADMSKYAHGKLMQEP